MSNSQLAQEKTAATPLRRSWHFLRGCYRLAQGTFGAAISFLFKAIVVGYFIFCALILALRYLVLPNIEGYKPQIEELAGRAVGTPVSIGALHASWSGLRPRLALDTVIIHDDAGQPALTLPRVDATLSWLTLLVGELRLNSLEIDRPELEIRREQDGRIFVAGIPIDPGRKGDDDGADWVLSQHEIHIRNGRLRWDDRMRTAPALVLDQVDLILRNGWRTHRLALQARPPADVAAPLDVRAVFQHPPFAQKISDPRGWHGELYVDVRDTDLAVWRAYVDYPIELQQGRGAVRAWMDFDRARIADLTADLALTQVAARLKPELAPLRLPTVSGRVALRENMDGARGTAFGGNGLTVSLTDFTLRTDDGLYLPPTTVSQSHVPARDGRAARTEITAGLVDLETLAAFADRLPLPADQRRLLADFAPRGVLRNLSAQWQGSYPEISTYNLRGQFTGLTMNARAASKARAATGALAAVAAIPDIPGFSNLSGRIEASERGGTLMLDARDLVLQMPAYFAQAAMPFERLQMQANWSLEADKQFLVDVQRFDFAQQGIEGVFSARHHVKLDGRDQGPGTLDLNGRLNRVALNKVGRYLPLQTPSTLHHWLSGALLGGEVEDVHIRVNGDLAHFPFRAGQPGKKSPGSFSVVGRLVDASLDYAPGRYAPGGGKPEWPVIDRIAGRIAFDGARMEIRADSARTAGADLSDVKVVIPDLAAAHAQLDVDGTASGPLQNLVQFTRLSPVGQWIEGFTDETSAGGNAKLALKLNLPLDHMDQAKVRGALHFSGNTVRLMEAIPQLTNATGILEFDEKGFTLNGVRSSFLGGPVAVSGGTQRDGTILVRVDGTASMAGIRQAYALPASGAAAERATGSTRYQAVVRVRDGNPAITVDSSLVGIGLNFPAPLRKAPGEAMPLHFELTQLPTSDRLLLRDQIRLSLGATINAHYRREKPAARNAAWRVINGGIGVNAPAPQPDSGVYANLNMPSLDIDAWRQAVSSLLPAAPAVSAKGEAASSLQGMAQYIEPEVMAARAGELIVMERRLTNVVVGATRADETWQANLDSEQASGYVTWTEPRSGRGVGKATARLASLVIPESAAPAVENLLEAKGDVGRLPALDIVAENFVLFGKRFGQLELVAANARGANGWEWQISKLALANPDGELKASGRWSGRAGASRSALDYTLVINDAGKLLDRFGFGNVLRGGKGKMEGDINWRGPPFDLDVASMQGKIKLELAAGQFLKVDQASQGAAKLLGVLSLQSLPRRLALDFRDVFSEGFAFDGVVATANIADGVARTDNFKMRGVSATVLIDGSADIVRENQDLHVVVIPEINAGAASVVYGLAVNPVIGVGTFLAQLFLREPLMKAFTFEYQVSGPWKEPVVTRLARKQSARANPAPAQTDG